MNRGPVIFFSAFLAFALSFAVFVLAPQVQLGRQSLTTALGTENVYPQARPGQAAQGAQIYRANGCAACHSQQVRQTGVHFDLVFTEKGTNTAAVFAALQKLKPTFDEELNPVINEYLMSNFVAKFSQTILHELPAKAEAVTAQKTLKAAGAKSDVQIIPFGLIGWAAWRDLKVTV